MDLLILIGLIILNGLFAMSEISLVASRKARLTARAEAGDQSSALALKLAENPTRFLSTVQIGITTIGLLNGIVGEAALAGPMAQWMKDTFGTSDIVSRVSATTLVVVGVTYLSIVIGELVPKRIGQINPEAIARLVARPMQALATLARPFIFLLSVSTNALLKIMGVKDENRPSVTEDEIFAVLQEGSESGAIENSERDLVRSMLRLDDRQLSSLMVPRSEIVYLDIRRTNEENLNILLDSAHSRFPVCDGGLDNILGFVYAKKILTSVIKGSKIEISDFINPALFVPETLTGMDLLEEFRDRNLQVAFVVDEYGGLDGMVTLKDLLKALTGEMAPQGSEEPKVVKRLDGSWLLDGGLSVHELKELLGLKNLPEEGSRQYQTLNGMMTVLFERLPEVGDYVDWQDWRFEIVDIDGRKVDKVLAKALKE